MAYVSPVGDKTNTESQDHGYLGQLGQVLSLYPDGRDAVSSMNSKVMTEGVLDQAVRSVVASAAAIKWAASAPIAQAGTLGSWWCSLATPKTTFGQCGTARSPAGGLRRSWPWSCMCAKRLPNLTEISQADVDALTAIGWTEQEVVEGTLMAAHAAFTTTLAQSMHLEHDAVGPEFDGYF